MANCMRDILSALQSQNICGVCVGSRGTGPKTGVGLTIGLSFDIFACLPAAWMKEKTAPGEMHYCGEFTVAINTQITKRERAEADGKLLLGVQKEVQ